MGLMQGITDNSINATGVLEAELCAEVLKGEHFITAYTSDMMRTDQVRFG